MGGEEGKTSFGSDNVMVVGIDDEDAVYRLFEEWLVELEEVTAIWSCGRRKYLVVRLIWEVWLYYR